MVDHSLHNANLSRCKHFATIKHKSEHNHHGAPPLGAPLEQDPRICAPWSPPGASHSASATNLCRSAAALRHRHRRRRRRPDFTSSPLATASTLTRPSTNTPIPLSTTRATCIPVRSSLRSSEAGVLSYIEYDVAEKIAIAIRTGGHQYSGASSTSGSNIVLDVSLVGLAPKQDETGAPFSLLSDRAAIGNIWSSSWL